MIRNILFDMGGVVFDIDTEEALRRFAALGVDSKKYLGAYGQKGIFHDVEAGLISAEEFCNELAKMTGRANLTFEQAQHCWMGFMKGVDTSVLHTLLRLKKSYNLGLLSNTNPFIMAHVDSPAFSPDCKPVSHYFHKLYLSYEMKMCKPRHEIFLKTLEMGGYKASETLFIDDGLKNTEAAEACGIHALHIPSNQPWEEALNHKLQQF